MRFTDEELQTLRAVISDRYFYWKKADEGDRVPRGWRGNNIAAHRHKLFKSIYEKLGKL